MVSPLKQWLYRSLAGLAEASVWCSFLAWVAVVQPKVSDLRSPPIFDRQRASESFAQTIAFLYFMEFSGKLGEKTLFLCGQVDGIALLRQIMKKAGGMARGLPLIHGAYQPLRMLCIKLAHGCYFRAISPHLSGFRAVYLLFLVALS